ncbi:MAG: cysteine-rich KTR domain-containing protein [Oscillospiraceae bacterium]
MNKEQKESRWIRCPVCRGKTRLKVYYNTALFNYPLFCPKCKTEKIIDVMQFKMAVSN